MNDLSKKGLGELVGALTPGQTVALVTVAAGLVSSSFGFGFWLGGTLEGTSHETTKLALVRVEAQRDLSDDRVANLLADIELMTEDQAYLKSKDKLLALMVLWHDARQKVDAGSTDPEHLQKYEELSQNLFNLVITLDQSSTSGEATAQFDVRINKGSTPTVSFVRDESSLPLPASLFATAE